MVTDASLLMGLMNLGRISKSIIDTKLNSVDHSLEMDTVDLGIDVISCIQNPVVKTKKRVNW